MWAGLEGNVGGFRGKFGQRESEMWAGLEGSVGGFREKCGRV